MCDLACHIGTFHIKQRYFFERNLDKPKEGSDCVMLDPPVGGIVGDTLS